MLRLPTRTELFRSALLLIAAAALLTPSACVRRTVTFKTVPDGATVRLNDQDIGQTPVTVDFTWYGDYDIAYEKDGYETLRTHKKLDAPWYQIPPIDLLAETLVPYTIVDRRLIEAELAPATQPSRQELTQRAKEFRDRTLFGKD